MSLSDDISKIVTQMKTQATTTLGWDVIVNYDEAELNKLLAAAYKEDSTGERSIKKFECSLTTTDDKTGEDYTIDYAFNLGPPLIKFIATYLRPACSFVIPVLGGTAKLGDISQTIGERIYSLTLSNLELAAARGGVSAEATLFSQEDPIHYNEPLVFSENSEEKGVVFINFEASKYLITDLAFTGPEKCPKGSVDPGCEGRVSFIDNHLGDLKDIIRNVFIDKYKNIQYELARTSNSKPENGIQSLVPKSFMFATYIPKANPGTDTVERTILSLFIRTSNTDNGLKHDLQVNWQALWGTTLGCHPIPSGKTASIILAKNTVFTSMIEPGLKTQGYSSQLDDTKGSLQMQVKSKQEIHKPKHSEVIVDVGSVTTQCRNTAIDVVLPDLQLVLEQNLSNDKAHCRGSWTYDYSFSWYIFVNGKGSEGTVNVKNELAEDPSPIELDSNYSLKMSFRIRKEKWKVTATADSKTFWEKFCGGSEDIPNWIMSLNLFHPEMNIDMGSLNFFVTTNLLLPSREVIDIDRSLGVQVPGDFYIVGNVKKIIK